MCLNSCYIQKQNADLYISSVLNNKNHSLTVFMLLYCIIILSLLIAFQVLAHFEKRENQDYDKQTLTTEDFTVSLKNLPSKS